MNHWMKAQQIFSKLEEIGYAQPLLKANSKELY
jgi:hypothetical protein